MNIYPQKIKDEIKELIKTRPNNYGQCCASKSYKELGDKIFNLVPLLQQDNFSFKTRMYWILNDIFDFPKCEVCGKPIYKNVNTLQFGYATRKDALWTCCEKCKNKAIRDKAKETNLKKYGAENPFAAKEIIAKIKQTNIQRYGIENGGNTNDGRKRAKQTLISRFGKEGLKSQIILERKKATSIKKYGAEFYQQTSEYKKNIQKRNLNRFLKILLQDNEIQLLISDEYKNANSIHDIYDLKFHCLCKKCGKEFIGKINLNNFYKHNTFSSCPTCHPSASSSFYEKELSQFIKSIYNNDIICNSRKVISPYELDIYIPNKKLAIEYDGLYWHSTESDINKNYHLMKTEKCEKQGIQLIHVFENEWLSKQDIVKSRLKNLLGIYDKTVFARKCEVKEVDSKTSKAFQDENHIQGAVNAKVNVGLYYDNELISLMTFGKTRFSKKYEWEMLRFCNKLGYHIPGAAGKLLKHFEKTYNPKSLVSYADRRWSTGKLYKALGFTLDHISAPNYWYWKSLKLESRIKYQKHKLKNVLANYNPNISEIENMHNNGYRVIYDCGNLVFIKMYNI